MTIESKHSRKRLHCGIVIDQGKAAGRLLSVLLVNLSLVSPLLADDWPQWRPSQLSGATPVCRFQLRRIALTLRLQLP